MNDVETQRCTQCVVNWFTAWPFFMQKSNKHSTSISAYAFISSQISWEVLVVETEHIDISRKGSRPRHLNTNIQISTVSPGCLQTVVWPQYSGEGRVSLIRQEFFKTCIGYTVCCTEKNMCGRHHSKIKIQADSVHQAHSISWRAEWNWT